MKQFAATILLLIALGQWTAAQSFFGIKSAYTISTVHFSPTTKTKSLFSNGLDWGVTFRHFSEKYLGIQAELYVTKRGYRKAIDREQLGDTMLKRVSTYLELPLFFQVRINLQVITLYVNAGPYVSYMLSAREGDNSTGTYRMSSVSLSPLRDNRFDYGLIGGFGITRSLLHGTIFAEGRIGYGFGNLYNRDYEGMPSQSHPSVISITLGYLYRFGDNKITDK